MRWSDLTTRDVDALARTTPVVLNIAAVEQHGPHLPVDTDSTIGAHFLERLDTELGENVLTLPQIAVGCSDHHRDFTGTLSVGHETFIAYAGDIARSVMGDGFQALLILNSHGGNRGAGQVLLEKLGPSYPDRQIALATWWQLAAEPLTQLRESAPGGVNHAGEFETSLMLHIAPERVRRDLIGGHSYAATHAWADADMLHPAQATLYRSMRAMSDGRGTVGDPSLASADKGRRISEAVVKELCTVVGDLHDAATRQAP
ncbi:creatininase family protein [Rhodovibrio salinarum]|uniref:Creatininase n=1 Tax=Rhodovibrio salinarum TaxID=1087 RepID=A0A934QGJ9_9PROT|nr:creatininase family protein [Rhodovibrio salinarum]MBK1696601.1 creatininase [Rhodovibrio salinarum]